MMKAAFCISESIKGGGGEEGGGKPPTPRFELRDVPIPSLTTATAGGISRSSLPSGSILVKVVALSICGSDFCGTCGGGSWRKPTDSLPLLEGKCGGTGHEALGEVVDVVQPCRLEIGTRILAFPPDYIEAVETLRKVFEKATGGGGGGGGDCCSGNLLVPKQGAFAEYFVSHDSVCIEVPKELEVPATKHFDPLWFVLAQPLGTLLHACKKIDGSILGKTVCIVGQGQNGLMMTQLIEKLGAKRIIVLDLLPERLKVSKQIFQGVHCILSSSDPTKYEEIQSQLHTITNGEMCDVTIEMVGHQSSTLNLSASLTKNGGTVLLFGLPPATVEKQFTIPFQHFKRNLKYVCSHSPSLESFELAVEFIKQGRFGGVGTTKLLPSLLFTHTMPFVTEFPKAYEIASEYKDGVIKILLTF